MPNRPEDKASVLKRVRRIKGQCDGLERALEDGVDCGALLQQIAAVRGAINGLMAEVLETHLRDELVPPDTEADQKVQDLLGLVRTYLK